MAKSSRNPLSSSRIREAPAPYPTRTNALQPWAIPALANMVDHENFVKKMSLYIAQLPGDQTVLSWYITFMNYFATSTPFDSHSFINIGYHIVDPIVLPQAVANVAIAPLGGIDAVGLLQVMFGMLCVVIGKVLTATNFIWMTRRLYALCGQLGIDQNVTAALEANINGNQIPWIYLSKALSRCAKARQQVFFVISSVGDSSIFTPACTWALSTLEFGYMSHVTMIEEFIINADHPVLTIPELQTDLRQYHSMWNQLRNLDALAKYARILYDDDDVPTVNPKHFPKLFLAAVVIGRRRKPTTMANFRAFNVTFEQNNAAFTSLVIQLDTEFLNQLRVPDCLRNILSEGDIKNLNEFAMIFKDSYNLVRNVDK